MSTPANTRLEPVKTLKIPGWDDLTEPYAPLCTTRPHRIELNSRGIRPRPASPEMIGADLAIEQERE